jgi:hypothetical protein
MWPKTASICGATKTGFMLSNAGATVNAVIKIYDVLGQELSEDHFTLNSLYQKEIDDIEAAYVIVSVKNNDKITTRKVFVSNIR